MPRAEPGGQACKCGPLAAEQLKKVLQSLAGLNIRPVETPHACAGVG